MEGRGGTLQSKRSACNSFVQMEIDDEGRPGLWYVVQQGTDVGGPITSVSWLGHADSVPVCQGVEHGTCRLQACKRLSAAGPGVAGAAGTTAPGISFCHVVHICVGAYERSDICGLAIEAPDCMARILQLARYVGGLDFRSSGANQPHGLCWSLSQAPPGAANARKVEECEQGRGEDPTCGYGSVVC